MKNYTIVEELFSGKQSTVYRCKQKNTGKSVIIKVLNGTNLSKLEIARFEHEYHILKEIDEKGVVVPLEFICEDSSWMLIMEDSEKSISLRRILKDQKLTLTDFLELSIRITDILGRLHLKNVIHKDIKPDNIIMNPENGDITIIDFGLATKLGSEILEMKSEDALEGTLQYISPEQTGRMNRSLDYRTDFYSLGITFYEILAGELPFSENDSIGWIHAQIAKRALSLSQKNQAIPKVISDVVEKLMSKNVEDRYKSAYGIKHDLEVCLERLNKTGEIAFFEPATKDISDKLNIPQKLYGREKEVNRLLEIFENTAIGESQMMLVAGYSGVGKTALVNEIKRTITKQKGYFISGKFNQFQKSIPYSAVIRSFQTLISYLLTESNTKIEHWKEKLLKALGTNGQVIIDVIPEIELITGKQSEVPELGPVEAQNRFNMVFQNFISVFTKKEHPLVIFLDDLQWADSASLNLIKNLITAPESKYLMLISAYRDNEVSQSHPTIITIEEIKNTKKVEHLFIKPLEIADTTLLVSETILKEPEISSPLAKLIQEKTAGNPFFVIEFLKTIYDKELIRFNFNKGSWEFDVQQINNLDITDNVVELLSDKISDFSPQTQDVLKIAACIGNTFNLSLLSKVYKYSVQDTIKNIWPAVEKGFIITSKDFDRIYSLVCLEDENQKLPDEIDTLTGRFMHDRVQQAAYSLISDNEKKAVHINIGRLTLDGTTERYINENIFDIVGHFNEGIELIETEEERILLAQLNIKAAKKALDATAFLPALSYCNIAKELLPDNTWVKYYELSFEVQKLSLKLECFAGDINKADDLFAFIISETKSEIEKAEIYIILMNRDVRLGQYQKVIDRGIEILELIGISIPTEINQIEEQAAELTKAISLFVNEIGSINEIKNLPLNKDELDGLITEIMLIIIIPSLFTGQGSLNNFIISKLCYYSMKNGTTPFSSSGYSWLAYNNLRDENYELAYEYGILALDFANRFGNKSMLAEIHNLVGINFRILKEPYRNSLNDFKHGFLAAEESGSFQFAVYILGNIVIMNFLNGGMPLDELIKKSDELIAFAEQKSPNAKILYVVWKQLFLALSGNTEVLNSFTDENFDESKIGEIISAVDALTWWGYFTVKIYQLFISEDFEAAYDVFQKFAPLSKALASGINTEIYFIGCLICAELYQSSALEEKKAEYFQTNEEFFEKISRLAELSPENFEQKKYLIQARWAEIEGKNEEAIKFYEKASGKISKDNFLQNTAILNELIARFRIRNDVEKVAQVYLEEAINYYSKWGAHAKVAQLNKKYPQILHKNLKYEQNSYSTTISTRSGSADMVDLSSILKASQSLSGEVKLEKLLKSMLSIIMENAGAEYAVIIKNNDNNFTIEAKGKHNADDMKLLQSENLEESNSLALNIVKYVIRTGKMLVINNAVEDENFSDSEYIQDNIIKSVFCYPVIHKNKLVAILYLENNLSTYVFTPQHIETINILSSQIAVSIENALLYENLEAKVNMRTRELNEANEELNQTNEELQATIELVQEQKELLEKSKEKLEISHEQITSSINYAKRIQDAVLPSLSLLEDNFSEYFVLFQPRDIVSGDFYWAKKIDNYIIVAAADCTGHGVPGAFVSMLGISFLNEISSRKEVISAAQILESLRTQVKQSLNQEQGEKFASTKDGMDIALCVIDTNTSMLQFAGAYNPLYIIRNKELNEIKATRCPIGVYNIEKEFVNNEIQLNTGDCLYFCSDGYQDQFGGKNIMKFKSNNFKDLLIKISEEPMNIQKNLLIENFNNWKGSLEQIDDVLVVGLKI